MNPATSTSLPTAPRRPQAPLLAALVACMLAVAGVAAQVPPALVEDALDQPIERLEIPAAPLPDVLARIERETGLRFQLTRAALDLMPYGEQTLVLVEIHRMSVRRGLQRVLSGLGLEMTREGDRLIIAPRRGLDRLNRRLQPEELELVARLSREPWSQAGADSLIDLRIDPQRSPRAQLDAALSQSSAQNALDSLDSATDSLGWAWRLDAGRLIVCTRADEYRRRLDLPLDLAYQRRPLDGVLVELGQRAGVTVLFEPGCLKRIDARDRAVDLVQRGATVRQVFERIAGNTGLAFEVTGEGVRWHFPGAAGADAQRPAGDGQPQADMPSANLPRSANPPVADHHGALTNEPPALNWVTLPLEIRPGLTVHVLVPLEQLPLDVRDEVERRIRAILSGEAPAGLPRP